MEYPVATRREKLSWAFFDFANSSFTTVIITVVFGPFFVGRIVGDGVRFLGLKGESCWLLALALSQGLVLVSAPIIGAMADRRAAKKAYLFRSFVICVGATALLTFSGPGTILFSFLLVVVANIAFSTGENLVAGFLPELAGPGEIGRLSGLAWAIGYVGGLISLVLAIPFAKPELAQWTCLTTALFFGISGIPTFCYVKERALPRVGNPSLNELVRDAFKELTSTWRQRRDFRDLFRFLLCILVFQAGVAIVIGYAGVYAGEELDIDEKTILWLFMALQLAAGVGALAFGVLQDRLGSKPSLILSLLLWMAAVVAAFAAGEHDVAGFAVAGCLAGAAMGGSQSASRALVGIMAPKGREAEWFGLWGFATKGAAVLGPLVFLAVVESTDRRTAILSTLVLFVLGLLIFLGVNIGRAEQAARDGAVHAVGAAVPLP